MRNGKNFSKSWLWMWLAKLLAPPSTISLPSVSFVGLHVTCQVTAPSSAILAQAAHMWFLALVSPHVTR